MASSVVSSRPVINWDKVFISHEDEVVQFAEGEIGFRTFQRSLSGDARKEVNKLAGRESTTRRTLVRRACQRRLIPVLSA